MTIQVHSEATGRMEPCTLHTGVLGSDGVRYGALADIDAYLMALDTFDPTPLDKEGWSDKALRDYVGPARVQQFEYCDEKQLRENERLERLDRMCEIAEQCETAGVSIVDQLESPVYI